MGSASRYGAAIGIGKSVRHSTCVTEIRIVGIIFETDIACARDFIGSIPVLRARAMSRT